MSNSREKIVGGRGMLQEPLEVPEVEKKDKHGDAAIERLWFGVGRKALNTIGLGEDGDDVSIGRKRRQYRGANGEILDSEEFVRAIVGGRVETVIGPEEKITEREDDSVKNLGRRGGRGGLGRD